MSKEENKPIKRSPMKPNPSWLEDYGLDKKPLGERIYSTTEQKKK